MTNLEMVDYFSLHNQVYNDNVHVHVYVQSY